MSEKYTLTPVEQELMNILWAIEQGSVRDVMAKLSAERPLAYTSVSTILRILQQKQIVTTQKIGKQHIYIPLISRSAFAAHSVTKMVRHVFFGDSVAMVAQLIDKSDLSLTDITAIQNLIDAKKKGNGVMNWHYYLLLNLGVACAYPVARLILHLRQQSLASQRLCFARYALLMTSAVFLLMPWLQSWLPIAYDSTYHLEPFLRRAATTYLAVPVVMQPVNVASKISASWFTWQALLWLFYASLCFFIGNYLRNVGKLLKLTKNAYCQHRLHQVRLLVSDEITVPCCWSWFRSHYILLPATLLTKPQDLRLALRHELQHIRQGDTYWLHGLSLLSAICFWNPFIKSWLRWLDELQEFACDETVVTRSTVSATTYAECLVTVAAEALSSMRLPIGAVGLQGLSASLLARRVNHLFHYKESGMKKISLLSLYILSGIASVSVAFAVNGSSSLAPLSAKQIEDMIHASAVDSEFHLAATPDVVAEINRIRGSTKSRTYMRQTLHRMKSYQPVIQAELRKNGLPRDLMVMPFVESGYQPLQAAQNPVQAAGIWQIIPATAKQYGLTVTTERDDRLNTRLSTQAALAYLTATHAAFQDWKLACIAYEIGENNTEKLIEETHSHDPEVLAKAPGAPAELAQFVTQLDAVLIIMHNPSLIA